VQTAIAADRLKVFSLTPSAKKSSRHLQWRTNAGMAKILKTKDVWESLLAERPEPLELTLAQFDDQAHHQRANELSY
jgi:hypothetical protein